MNVESSFLWTLRSEQLIEVRLVNVQQHLQVFVVMSIKRFGPFKEFLQKYSVFVVIVCLTCLHLSVTLSEVDLLLLRSL